MFYTVYRTQNLVNGKYYLGVHKTSYPYDRYLGSGTVITNAVNKYGRPAFLKNVCFVFDTPEEAFAKEFELIETYREDPLCYNIRQGGSGGFDWINREGLRADNRNNPVRIAAVKSRVIGSRQSPSNETRIKIRSKLQGRIVGKRTEETREKIRAANKGKVLSEETKEKIRKYQLERRKEFHS
jgi:hypothetical protein